MELVADTNIIVAALLRKGLTRSLLFRQDVKFIAPAYVEEELNEHRRVFIKKSGLPWREYAGSVRVILSNLLIIEKSGYLGHERRARKISPDPKDWPFIAVALSKGCPLWSNDKRLKLQKEVIVYNTKELFELLPRERI